MSDYFAALMRASGLFTQAATPASDAPLELDVETPVPGATLAPAPRPEPSIPRNMEIRGTLATIEPPTVDTPAPREMAVDNSLEPGRPVANAQSDPPAQFQHRAPTQSQPASPAPQSEIGHHENPGAPDRADDPVRAAMRWVAADPQVPAPRERAQAGLLETPETGRSPLDAERPESTHQPNPTRLPDVQATKTTPRPESLSMPVAVTQPATPRVEPEAAGRVPEETLEISIGAIHLRVEAPAPQTLARPVAPPARTQQPAAPAPSTRSGLSRRALRRF
jgi:hypothetical protein